MLSLCCHHEPTGHDTPVASRRSYGGRILLQELHGIGGSVVTRTDLRPKARRPCCAAKWPSERREALEAEVARRWRTLSNGFQAIEDLKTISVTARIDSAKAKMMTMIVTHVEADLEVDTPQPPTWRAKCRCISCRKNTGYHATDPKIRTQGVERVRSRIATKHGDGSLELSNALRTTERDAELYPGSGPSW
jgi:hypothetical protein